MHIQVKAIRLKAAIFDTLHISSSSLSTKLSRGSCPFLPVKVAAITAFKRFAIIDYADTEHSETCLRIEKDLTVNIFAEDHYISRLRGRAGIDHAAQILGHLVTHRSASCCLVGRIQSKPGSLRVFAFISTTLGHSSQLYRFYLSSLNWHIPSTSGFLNAVLF